MKNSERKEVVSYFENEIKYHNEQIKRIKPILKKLKKNQPLDEGEREEMIAYYREQKKSVTIHIGS